MTITTPNRDGAPNWVRYVDSVTRQGGEITDRRDPSRPFEELEQFGPAFHNLLGEIEHDIRLLADLYVPARACQSDDQFLATNLHCLPPRKVAAITSEGRHLDFLRACSQDQLIYLIGPVGRGKTTFLHYQLRVALPKEHPELNLHPLIFDVRQCSSPLEFHQLFLRAIDSEIHNAFPIYNLRGKGSEERLHQVYCKVFRDELVKNMVSSEFKERGADAATYEQQARVFQRLREDDFLGFCAERIRYAEGLGAASARVLLAVDNADQHLMQEGGEQVILSSHAVAKKLQMPLILTLRHTSFRRNNAAFSTAAINPRFLFLSPASSNQMMARRLDRMRALVETDQPLRNFVGALAAHLTLEPTAGREKVEQLVRRWAEPLANGSRREVLVATLMLISSIHIASNRWDELRPRQDDYLAGDFEMLSAKVKLAFISGRNAHHQEDDSTTSYVINLFLPSGPRLAIQHMLRIKLLQHLSQCDDSGTTPAELIRLCIEALGNTGKSVVEEQITNLVQRGLAELVDESDTLSVPKLRSPIDLRQNQDNRLHLTQCGEFHLTTLLRDDIYLDEMKMVTPLPKSVAVRVFRNYFEAESPRHPRNRILRHDSTLEFLEYLIDCERKDVCQGLSAELGVEDVMPAVRERYLEVVREIGEHSGGGHHRRRRR